jgi:hypothetical protein
LLLGVLRPLGIEANRQASNDVVGQSVAALDLLGHRRLGVVEQPGVDPVLELLDRIGEPPTPDAIVRDQIAAAGGDQPGDRGHRGLLVILGEIGRGNEYRLVRRHRHLLVA